MDIVTKATYGTNVQAKMCLLEPNQVKWECHESLIDGISANVFLKIVPKYDKTDHFDKAECVLFIENCCNNGEMDGYQQNNLEYCRKIHNSDHFCKLKCLFYS